MRTVELGKTGITTSSLGFGCSAVMGRSGRRDSLRALDAAWELGITFFDTARCYGYGESEALLGEFLRKRRDKAVVSTKFGIMPSAQVFWKRISKPIARAALGILPASRSLLLRMASNQVSHGHFSVESLHQSVCDSLRALRTDYIDFLFLHDATSDSLENEELFSAIDGLIASGKVRVAGVSAGLSVIERVVEKGTLPVRALQFPCNVLGASCSSIITEADGAFATVANNPFGGVEGVSETRKTLKRIAATPGISATLRAKIGVVDDEVLADAVLNVILSSPGIQVVIPAMMNVRHIQNSVNAVTESRFSDGEIAWLRHEIVSSSLRQFE